MGRPKPWSPLDEIGLDEADGRQEAVVLPLAALRPNGGGGGCPFFRGGSPVGGGGAKRRVRRLLMFRRDLADWVGWTRAGRAVRDVGWAGGWRARGWCWPASSCSLLRAASRW